MNKTISTSDAPKPTGPCSQAIRAGSTVYCAGQTPIEIDAVAVAE
jgi:enamine deaminase RidA (YjgF/YER057c/UK114 family)